ncbi:hypothetical protein CKAH01_00272 [Colletotrichum kahawae]|uniref:Secreted protein n=1 Tax=Colletotrichum kahawae TaxID=34407 RepID=A0AAE0DCY4_COLKA|nr:hypothetical protein CKAH01_00272 [Colletotrichum kahawae]
MWLACVVWMCVGKYVLCACPRPAHPPTTTTPSSTWNPSNAISPALPWTMEPSPALPCCVSCVYDFPYVRCKLRAVCMVCLGCCPDSSSPHRACSKLASASRRKKKKQASAEGKLKPLTPHPLLLSGQQLTPANKIITFPHSLIPWPQSICMRQVSPPLFLTVIIEESVKKKSDRATTRLF